MRIILILIALLIAAGLTWFVTTQLEPTTTVETEIKREYVREPAVRVIVANTNMPAGRIISKEALAYQNWPESAVLPEFYTEQQYKDFSELNGFVVRTPIAKGEPLNNNKIVKPGERGFLAAVLREGMKAISVPVNDRTGISGFVMPGDYVDLILTQSVSFEALNGEEEERVTRQISETFIRNARVVGVNQSTGAPQEGGAFPKIATVTLELTPKLAEITALANELGRVTLALNPLASSDADSKAEQDEKFPYLVEGVDDKKFYSVSWDVDASPARKGDGSSASSDNSLVSIFRAGDSSKAKVNAPAETAEAEQEEMAN